MEDFGKYRGCFGVVAGFLAVAAFGGVGALLEPSIGAFTSVISLVGLIFGVALGVGVAKNARWAMVMAGVALSLSGLALSLLALAELGTGAFDGHSLFGGATGRSFGLSMFLLLATGIAMLFGGLYLAGWKRLLD